ncbi:hypothetical protein [Pseudidiomarina sp.]|uniref:hypothetical protein n=1 Tax=Pseudidiomarina sp. TaxID=2081707 RepID=UPI00299DEDAF|nr:hypothetical protein [Pseudidiomarina sp.]MDX1706262.1 hypothetical protein [Pseudidiomarina sp.]
MGQNNGFALPLVTALLTLFAGAWLSYQAPNQELNDLRRAQQLHQEFLFWHQGVLLYRKNHGYWPATLANLANSYSLPPVPDWLRGQDNLGNFRFVISGITDSQLAHFYEPLETLAQYNGDELDISLPEPGGAASSSVKVLRLSAQPPLMETPLSLNSHEIFNVAALSASLLATQTVKAADLIITDITINELTVRDLYGDDVIADGASLNQLYSSAVALYQALWDCMYVSGYCLDNSSAY